MNKFVKPMSIAALSLFAFSAHANFELIGSPFFPTEVNCEFTKDITIGQDAYTKAIDTSIFYVGGTWEVLAPLYRRNDGLYKGDTVCNANDTTGVLLDTFKIDFVADQNMSAFAEQYNLSYVSAQSKTEAVFKFNPEPVPEQPSWLPDDHGLAQAHAEDMAVKANTILNNSNVEKVAIDIKWNF